jgi:opacity protein-like surface antigen
MKKNRKCNFTGACVPRPNSAALAFACALIALVAGAASAQAPEPSAPPPVPPRAAPPTAAPLAAATQDPGKFYAFAGFAAFGPQKNSGLQNERGSLLNFISGAGYHAWPNVAVELNYLFDNRRLDTPLSAQPTGPFQAGTAKSYMFTSGLAASAKYRLGEGRLVPYVGGGMGVYRTRFLTTSEAPSCVNNCSDTGPRVTGSSTDLGYHAMAGADYSITAKDRISAELRYLKLDADFGSILPGKVNAGGMFLWVGYRRAFF